AGAGMELVGGSQEGGVEGRPPRRLRSFRDTGNLLLAQARLPGDEHVLAPLIGRAAVPAGPQDQKLALAGRELAGQQLASERQPVTEQPGMADEGGEDVRGRA